MDEARKVIRRLERIEALQSSLAPAEQLLGEVRQLLSEGEAWLAAERDEARHEAAGASDGAAVAHAGGRGTIATNREVMPETAGATNL